MRPDGRESMPHVRADFGCGRTLERRTIIMIRRSVQAKTAQRDWRDRMFLLLLLCPFLQGRERALADRMISPGSLSFS